jgi:hypothetical protein
MFVAWTRSSMPTSNNLYVMLLGLETRCLARTKSTVELEVGRAVAQAVSRWLPTAAAWVRVRAACGFCGGQSGTGARFFPSTSVSPANHSTNYSIIIITQGWQNRPTSGRSAEWTQFDSTPIIPIKKFQRSDVSQELNIIITELHGRLKLYFVIFKTCRHLLAVCLSNVGALTSRNPMDLHGL